MLLCWLKVLHSENCNTQQDEEKYCLLTKMFQGPVSFIIWTWCVGSLETQNGIPNLDVVGQFELISESKNYANNARSTIQMTAGSIGPSTC